LETDFLLVNDASLHPVLHRFQVIVDYWLILCFLQVGASLLTYSFGVNP